MTQLDRSRRSFLKSTVALTGGTLLGSESLLAQPTDNKPLLAYVGTFSSPLRDVLPTQVDLPPGNGRGIHLFQVDRTTGVLAPRSGSTLKAKDRPMLLAKKRAKGAVSKTPA